MLRGLSYDERLAVLDLETLEYRRLKSDLVLYYKIINNLTIWCPSSTFDIITPVRDTRLTAESAVYIKKPLCRTNMYENNFFQRCVSCWNSLPGHVVRSDTINNLTMRCHVSI